MVVLAATEATTVERIGDQKVYRNADCPPADPKAVAADPRNRADATARDFGCFSCGLRHMRLDCSLGEDRQRRTEKGQFEAAVMREAKRKQLQEHTEAGRDEAAKKT